MSKPTPPRSFTNDPASGPSLETYVETRFNLLVDFINEKFSAQDVAMRASMETARVAMDALEKTQAAMLLASDVRYQQRFEAQSDALAAAFQSQQQAMQCVSADTPILCADLTWQPAGELEVGEELVAFDEHAANRQGRRFRKSVVTANALIEDALIHVSTPVGSVRCNHAHPWLVRRPDKNAKWRWIRTDNLLIGDEVLHAMDVWATDRSWEAGWLAGIFDGEGCIRIVDTGVRLYVTQREGDLSDSIQAALTERLGREPICRQTSASRHHPHAVNQFEVNRRTDVLKLLGSVRPLRLMQRSDAMWEDRYLSGTGRSTTISAIEDAGRGEIASLSTSTRTYIAGGFAMHNTAFTVAEKAVQSALAAADRAVSKAELAADKRFESVNEFRKTLDDQQRTLMPREEVNVIIRGQSERITLLKEQIDHIVSERLGIKGGYGYAVGIAGFLLTLIALYRIFAGGKP